ncbi:MULTISPECIES: hypothetical protein [Streptomyces]|uniref:HicA-like toxin n=1 Tax=Streptomyces cyanogenus TaxID=80860 RepID=A0ABX7U2B3_STRCY|nr:hypothetical protein [Streptomyces cyanogenus]QTD95795.1 hypothetical protein S1361_00485 [Streptomyces cyanogenus]QTE03195.1 hypothetical protein S1361_38015 [Streptomyces cyanogenus]
MAKEERDLAKRAEEQGFEVRRTSKGHYMVTKDGERITTISGTSSDPRALKNAKAQLKRAGFIDK